MALQHASADAAAGVTTGRGRGRGGQVRQANPRSSVASTCFADTDSDEESATATDGGMGRRNSRETPEEPMVVVVSNPDGGPTDTGRRGSLESRYAAASGETCFNAYIGDSESVLAEGKDSGATFTFALSKAPQREDAEHDFGRRSSLESRYLALSGDEVHVQREISNQRICQLEDENDTLKRQLADLQTRSPESASAADETARSNRRSRRLVELQNRSAEVARAPDAGSPNSIRLGHTTAAAVVPTERPRLWSFMVDGWMTNMCCTSNRQAAPAASDDHFDPAQSMHV